MSAVVEASSRSGTAPSAAATGPASGPVTTIVGGAPPSAARAHWTSAASSVGSLAAAPSARRPAIRPPRRTESALRVRCLDSAGWHPAWQAVDLPHAVEIAIGQDDGRGGTEEFVTAVALQAATP